MTRTGVLPRTCIGLVTALLIACGHDAPSAVAPVSSVVAVTAVVSTATPKPPATIAPDSASPPIRTFSPPMTSLAPRMVPMDAAVDFAVQYAQQPMSDGTRLLSEPTQIVARMLRYQDANMIQTGRALPAGILNSFVWLIIMRGDVGMPGAPPVAHQMSLILDFANGWLLSAVAHPPGQELETGAFPTVAPPMGTPVPLPSPRPTP